MEINSKNRKNKHMEINQQNIKRTTHMKLYKLEKY